MVEAGGVEPPSESIPLKRLQCVSRHFNFALQTPTGQGSLGLARFCFAHRPTGKIRQAILLKSTLGSDLAGLTGRALAGVRRLKRTRNRLRLCLPTCLTRPGGISACSLSFNTPVEPVSPPFQDEDYLF